MVQLSPLFACSVRGRKILDGDIPSTKIFETEHSLAILDAFPSTPGHSLLIPKALVRNSLDMRLVHRSPCSFFASRTSTTATLAVLVRNLPV